MMEENKTLNNETRAVEPGRCHWCGFPMAYLKRSGRYCTTACGANEGKRGLDGLWDGQCRESMLRDGGIWLRFAAGSVRPPTIAEPVVSNQDAQAEDKSKRRAQLETTLAPEPERLGPTLRNRQMAMALTEALRQPRLLADVLEAE
jgi:hypothetical protein